MYLYDQWRLAASARTFREPPMYVKPPEDRDDGKFFDNQR